MLIGINVKGASKKVTQLVYEYEYSAGDTVAIGDFLDATVEITYKRYIETVTDLQGNMRRTEISSRVRIKHQINRRRVKIHVSMTNMNMTVTENIVMTGKNITKR